VVGDFRMYLRLVFGVVIVLLAPVKGFGAAQQPCPMPPDDGGRNYFSHNNCVVLAPQVSAAPSAPSQGAVEAFSKSSFSNPNNVVPESLYNVLNLLQDQDTFQEGATTTISPGGLDVIVINTAAFD